MSNDNIDLQQMLRRALIAQSELGGAEMVMASLARPEAKAVAREISRVVSISEGLGLNDSNVQPIAAVTRPVEPEFESLTTHCEAIKECLACDLGRTRTKFVYGVGNPKAKLMFVGEAPGADEDRLGEPFVGRAGQLLDKIVIAMGLQREDIYIANILKCRPPGNRDPQPEEMDQCFGYLREQVRLIKPKVICALGRIAAQALLETKTPLGKLRGDWHTYEGVPLIVTYHPAALLRFVKYKKDTWEDMKMLQARFDKLT